MRTLMVFGALALAGCSAATIDRVETAREDRATRELADALKGRTAGPPQDCVNAGTTGGPQIISDRILLYRDAGKIYRNDLESSCPSLSPGDTLIVEIRGSQLCRNDLFRAHQPGTSIPGPFCRLGSFTPYKKD